MKRSKPEEPAWMRDFGKLKRLHEETERVKARVDQTIEVIEPEDR